VYQQQQQQQQVMCDTPKEAAAVGFACICRDTQECVSIRSTSGLISMLQQCGTQAMNSCMCKRVQSVGMCPIPWPPVSAHTLAGNCSMFVCLMPLLLLAVMLQIAVLKEMDAKGPFVSLVMGVVVLKDVAVIVLFALNMELVPMVRARRQQRHKQQQQQHCRSK
jgi:hypothetical protein